MKLSTLLFAFLLTVSGFAQDLEFEATGFVSGDSGTLDYTFTITNTGTEDARFFWEIDRPADMPRDWQFSICDSNVCYPLGTESPTCDDSGINFIGAGQSITYYKVGIKVSEDIGEFDVVFRIIDDCAVTDPVNLGEIVITFNALPPSNVSDLEFNEDIVLYPNPTVDRFQINQDQNVSNIAVFNIVGKQIMNQSHRKGQSHDVSDLENGFYLVRMLDRNNNTLKVIRLTKE